MVDDDQTRAQNKQNKERERVDGMAFVKKERGREIVGLQCFYAAMHVYYYCFGVTRTISSSSAKCFDLRFLLAS